jgi:predicted AlkP superfamily pyrophosphatase or phosphodiesterase
MTGARPVLAVFLDGLGADAIERMPFLAAQTTVRRMRTELGYSITCHASMYTGLRPDRHGLWFVWQRDPGRSPFRWLRPLRFLDRIDSLPLHVLATKVTRRFVRTTSWFGIPYPVHVPWRYLPDLDVSERKLWPEPGYLTTAPTIFDLLRASGTAFEIVGMARGAASGIDGVQTWQPPAHPMPLTYLFAGEVDHASHAHGQRAQEVTDLLATIDRLIEDRFNLMRAADPDLALVVWSDHGHHDVQRLNPLPLLAEHDFDLKRYLHVIDTNYLRLWIDDEGERMRVIHQLNALGIGHVLTEAELERYRVRMPDDRYGNVIFYLELPYAFSHTIWGFGRRLASAHGYLPDHPGSDGVFVSNLAAGSGPFDLVDVAPSLLELLNVQAPAGLDGGSVWSPPFVRRG